MLRLAMRTTRPAPHCYQRPKHGNNKLDFQPHSVPCRVERPGLPRSHTPTPSTHKPTSYPTVSLAEENALAATLKIADAFDTLMLAHKKEVHCTIVTAEVSGGAGMGAILRAFGRGGRGGGVEVGF